MAMSPPAPSSRPLLLGAVLAAALAVGAYAYTKRPTAREEFQGWVEAVFIFVSADETGRVEALSVQEGDKVTPGQPLFTLDADLQRAAVAEADAAVINARITNERAKELLRKAVGSQKTFDDSEAALRTAEAKLNSARTHLERRRMASPVAGTVQEIYFRVGEMVPGGRPILSLLPPRETRIRFFVPQAMLPRFAIGDRIAVRCDGCAADLAATVNFISAQAEFTPPIIYSQEERARLVFRLEAIPEAPEKLRVGQPVSVSLTPVETKAAADAKR
jgi:HlyD family secretion protein